jgi:hypothetical protein
MRLPQVRYVPQAAQEVRLRGRGPGLFKLLGAGAPGAAGGAVRGAGCGLRRGALDARTHLRAPDRPAHRRLRARPRPLAHRALPRPAPPRESGNESVPAGGCPALVSSFPSGGEDMVPPSFRGTSRGNGGAAGGRRSRGGNARVSEARDARAHVLPPPPGRGRGTRRRRGAAPPTRVARVDAMTLLWAVRPVNLARAPCGACAVSSATLETAAAGCGERGRGV